MYEYQSEKGKKVIITEKGISEIVAVKFIPSYRDRITGKYPDQTIVILIEDDVLGRRTYKITIAGKDAKRAYKEIRNALLVLKLPSPHVAVQG